MSFLDNSSNSEMMMDAQIKEINDKFYNKHHYEKFNNTNFILKTNNFIKEPKNFEQADMKQNNAAVLTVDIPPLSMIQILILKLFLLVAQDSKKGRSKIILEGNNSSFFNESEDDSFGKTAETADQTKNIEFLIRSCQNQLSKTKVRLLTSNTDNNFPEDYNPKLLTTDRCK